MENIDNIRKILGGREKGQVALGWVKTKRLSPNVFFIALADGSTPAHLQVTGDPQAFQDCLDDIHAGVCLRVEGVLTSSPGSGQSHELVARKIEIVGPCDATTYPIQPKEHSLEFLRHVPHLRVRTTLFGAIFRIRHLMSQAFHRFFTAEGFYYVHTPIITTSDCEGAGDMFRVCKEGSAKEFFGERVHLTVSGQLEAEMLAMGLSKVYTFAPTFRAENSHTSRHLSEFWTIEPEMAFCNLKGSIEMAQCAMRYVIECVLREGKEDLAILHKRQVVENKKKKESERATPLEERLQLVVNNEWKEVDYTEAHSILKASKPNKKGKFVYPIVGWGQTLQTEHERFLVEQYFKQVVVVRNYPKTTKAFYMRLNSDQKTVAAMDILFPGIGEIVGGSQREERMDYLIAQLQERGMDQEKMQWYLDSRRYGSCPHAGFGIGFDRMVLFVTGMENIRDVIPFPRTPGGRVL